jgi:hypothetical protein
MRIPGKLWPTDIGIGRRFGAAFAVVPAILCLVAGLGLSEVGRGRSGTALVGRFRH